jgi:hypothetical protein
MKDAYRLRCLPPAMQVEPFCMQLRSLDLLYLLRKPVVTSVSRD